MLDSLIGKFQVHVAWLCCPDSRAAKQTTRQNTQAAQCLRDLLSNVRVIHVELQMVDVLELSGPDPMVNILMDKL